MAVGCVLFGRLRSYFRAKTRKEKKPDRERGKHMQWRHRPAKFAQSLLIHKKSRRPNQLRPPASDH